MKQELEKIKKHIRKEWGDECYKHGRVGFGCILCQIWRAIDILDQVIEFEADKLKHREKLK